MKHAGDYDGDGIHKFYWNRNNYNAYISSIMHLEGNIRYANYQNGAQMSDY